MAKALGIGLAVLMFIALLAMLAIFFHGLHARRQMTRYKRQAERLPVPAQRVRPKTTDGLEAAE